MLLYGRGGWLGGLADHGLTILFAVPGMVLATMFVSMPFVVREVVPVLREIGIEQEQAAETLGARAVPGLPPDHASRRSAGPSPTASCSRRPARSASSAPSARSPGNVEGKTQTLPLYVKAQFDGFDTAGAYASSVVLALIAIAVVVSLRVLQPKEH